jgi:Xaa-Pro aminopeptidase
MTLPQFLSPGFDTTRFTEALKVSGCDSILLTSPENVYYSTGYPSIASAGNPILYALRNVLPFYVWIDKSGKTTLLCWIGAAMGVEFGATQLIPFPDAIQARIALVNLLEQYQEQVDRIGIEANCPADIYKLLTNIYGEERIVFADNVLNKLRLVKSSQEIDYLRKSTSIVEQTVSEIIDMVHIGISRPELIHQSKYRMLKNGATGIGHITINFGASNPEVEIDETLEQNRLVVLDLGALYHGYASDNRRLLYTGPVPEGIRSLHHIMCEIVDSVASFIEPGKTFGEAYEYAINLYAKQNLQPFIPNIGHTIGLNTEEEWLFKDSRTIFEPGMVLNLEMYSLYQTGELIGDEETYLINEKGAQQLTVLPRTILSID